MVCPVHCLCMSPYVDRTIYSTNAIYALTCLQTQLLACSHRSQPVHTVASHRFKRLQSSTPTCIQKLERLLGSGCTLNPCSSQRLSVPMLSLLQSHRPLQFGYQTRLLIGHSLVRTNSLQTPQSTNHTENDRFFRPLSQLESSRPKTRAGSRKPRQYNAETHYTKYWTIADTHHQQIPHSQISIALGSVFDKGVRVTYCESVMQRTGGTLRDGDNDW